MIFAALCFRLPSFAFRDTDFSELFSGDEEYDEGERKSEKFQREKIYNRNAYRGDCMRIRSFGFIRNR